MAHGSFRAREYLFLIRCAPRIAGPIRRLSSGFPFADSANVSPLLASSERRGALWSKVIITWPLVSFKTLNIYIRRSQAKGETFKLERSSSSFPRRGKGQKRVQTIQNFRGSKDARISMRGARCHRYSGIRVYTRSER